MSKTVEKSPQIQLTHSERFTKAVLTEYAAKAPGRTLAESQKRLIQNYFIKLDIALKDAETKRLSKKNPDNDLPYKWENVDMPDLALDVVATALVGLDPLQSNHIHMIPYHDKRKGKYNIGFILGYSGMELKAKKYGIDVPDDITFQLVYSNDRFKEIRKDKNNPIDTYTFEVENSFDRGEIVGGFYYMEYYDNPRKNRLVVLSRSEIEKRKPKYASADFWGGEKDVWVNGQKTRENTAGWYAEMCMKTIKRHAYNSIVIDSQKIDDNMLALIQREHHYYNALEIGTDSDRVEIPEDANKTTISIPLEVVDEAEPESETPTSASDSKEQGSEQEQTGKIPGY